ncbi:IS630 family transposase (plasmid) [Deinococcus psychrotolerans]|uniref:IS630 family transposase n=1 Tax=Deinococcus psychrotolerans TaxID=2489213 RepID=A0A3G8YUL6_9DEIO|nr:IS630 family transposase [Deinococcus psychrotolerans]AZI44916.1 IS630 family transposase [Deinococcus psychrotolerans]
METVLDTYAQPYDASRPVICFDEKSYQLLDHVREPLPPVPGSPARVDHEYKRYGTVNFFVALEPHTGQRTVTVTDRRSNADFAEQLQCLELRYAVAEKIVLVLDQLSTHSPAALYQHLPAEEARRLSRRFEWIYTPKHASWLNMRAGPIWVPFCPRRRNWSGQPCNASVWVSAWRVKRPSSVKSTPGKQTATRGLCA